VHLQNFRIFNWQWIAVLVLGALVGAGPAPAQMPIPELGHKLNRLAVPVAAPDFSLKDMDGEQHSFKDYRGKVVMVNFWATWCPPCRREIPSMEALHQEFRDEAFAILAINEWESPDHVFAYMGQLSVFPNFSILFDQEGGVSEAFGVKGLPTTFLVDKRGFVVFKAVGGRDFNHPEVIRMIRELLR